MDKVDELTNKNEATEEKVANITKLAKLQQTYQEGYEEETSSFREAIESIQERLGALEGGGELNEGQFKRGEGA